MKNTISWKRVALFMAIAITISNIFRFDVFELQLALEKQPTWIYILSSIFLEGSGVIIGALLIIPMLKKERSSSMSLFGTSRTKSLIMVAIPIVLLTAIGVKNDFNMNANSYGLIASLGTIIYCIMEEYGWRGYLQEELKFMKSWQKYLLIGFLWYLWHLSFLTNASIGENLFFLSMLVFGSWGIGQVAELTKSIIACACFHMAIQIMMFNALIRNGINGTEKLIIFGICITLMYAIIKKWEKINNSTKEL